MWRRERPAADVYVHYPLSGLPHERTATFCGNLERSLRKAGVGASVAYVRAPTTTKVLPPAGAHPDYWKPEGNELVAYGAGSDRMAFTLARGGSYELWMEGTVGRPIKFVLDGRKVGTIAYEDRYPNQYLNVGMRDARGRSPHAYDRARRRQPAPGQRRRRRPGHAQLRPDRAAATWTRSHTGVNVAPAAAADADLRRAPSAMNGWRCSKPGAAPPDARRDRPDAGHPHAHAVGPPDELLQPPAHRRAGGLRARAARDVLRRALAERAASRAALDRRGASARPRARRSGRPIRPRAGRSRIPARRARSRSRPDSCSRVHEVDVARVAGRDHGLADRHRLGHRQAEALGAVQGDVAVARGHQPGELLGGERAVDDVDVRRARARPTAPPPRRAGAAAR